MGHALHLGSSTSIALMSLEPFGLKDPKLSY